MIAIKTENLTKKFGEKVAVNGLNLEVEEGELYSLLGVNGAGKTTTIRCLSCLTRPTSGQAYVLGDSVVADSQKVKQNIDVSPQETAVARNLTVRENLEFISSIYGTDTASAKQKAQQFIERFKMQEVAEKRAKTLSGGWARRLSIAMALITDPKVLFLDEPTLGLDVIARRELWHIVEALKGKMTIVLTTHYMEEAEALSDRVGIMSGGRLVAEGTPQEIVAQSKQDTFENAFIKIAVGEEAL